MSERVLVHECLCVNAGDGGVSVFSGFMLDGRSRKGAFENNGKFLCSVSY